MSPGPAARQSEGREARSVLRQGIDRLRGAGIAQARQEAEWLLGRLVHRRPLELHLEQRSVPTAVVGRFLAQIDARAGGIPLQYLLGETDFFGRRFAVGPGVFIPRPETEAVVAAAVGALRLLQRRRGRPLRLLDLGTGTGCIAVTLAHELPACVVVGVELSWEALCIARSNVFWHALGSRVCLLQADWMQALRGGFDGIVANPPYVPSAAVDRLPLDVRQEPRPSLDGGRDGMDALRRLLQGTPRLTLPGAVAAFECGEDQTPSLIELVRGAPWARSVELVRDLAGRPRGVLLHRRA